MQSVIKRIWLRPMSTHIKTLCFKYVGNDIRGYRFSHRVVSLVTSVGNDVGYIVGFLILCGFSYK